MAIDGERDSTTWRLEAAAASAVQDGLSPDEVRAIVERGIAAGLASATAVTSAKERADELLAGYRQRHAA